MTSQRLRFHSIIEFLRDVHCCPGIGMTVHQYFLFAFFCATPILALTIGSASASLWQGYTVTMPPSLTELLNGSVSEYSLGVRSPPRRWDYQDGIYDLSLYRGSITHNRGAKANPGVSIHNWDVAFRKAVKALEDESKAAGLTMYDPIPSGRFDYVTYLDRTATAHRDQHKLIFDIQGQQSQPVLLYHEVNITLTGLLAYQEQWKTPPSGSGKDLVRMPRFTLRMNDGESVFIANGTVGLSVPSGSNGLPVFTATQRHRKRPDLEI